MGYIVRLHCGGVFAAGRKLRTISLRFEVHLLSISCRTRPPWAERKAAGDSTFCVAREAQVLDGTLLRRAEDIFDAALTSDTQGGKGSTANPKATGSSKSGAIKCYKCGGWGHIASECRKGFSSKGGGKAGKSDKNACYKCGKTGHKAYDCW